MQSNIEQVFNAIISPDNTQRERAEEEFEQICKSNAKQALKDILNRRFVLPSDETEAVLR